MGEVQRGFRQARVADGQGGYQALLGHFQGGEFAPRDGRTQQSHIDAPGEQAFHLFGGDHFLQRHIDVRNARASLAVHVD